MTKAKREKPQDMAGDDQPKIIAYSETEARLLKLLPKDGSRVSTRELSKLLYGKKQLKEFEHRHAGIKIGTMMRSLIRKIEHNNCEPFRIMHSKRAGPKPMEFWREGILSRKMS